MVSDHLAEWLSQWQDVRELIRVSAEVDSVHEVAAITDRIRSPQGGPAILFDHVRGHRMPVVTNLLGSPRRLSAAFGASSLDGLSQRLRDWLGVSLPRNNLDLWKLLPRFAELTQWRPTLIKMGPCQQVVKLGRDVNLAELPAPIMWPGDAAPTITWGQLHSQFPKSDSQDSTPSIAQQDAPRIACVVPLEIRGRDRLVIHADEASEFWSAMSRYQALGQQMPVAVALGGDPLTSVTSWAPRPVAADPWVFAGFLRNRPVETVAARSIPLTVPAAAEIVIEGLIDAQATLETSAAISRESGFFEPQRSLPVLQVTAITHRANPVFPAMIPGPAPAEAHWLDRACERLLLPLAQLWVPELVDWRLPFSGACRHLVFASIRKSYAQQARQVMHALWSIPRLSRAKMIVIVDDDVPLDDEDAVWSAALAHGNPARDLVLWDGPADPLDPAAAATGASQKIGIDATRKLAGEVEPSAVARPLRWSPEIEARLRMRWPEFGL
jgi:4-hydroxy-3-polyprenylbenzoate decarboxylase